jgi:hypothetical protein
VVVTVDEELVGMKIAGEPGVPIHETFVLRKLCCLYVKLFQIVLDHRCILPT